MTQDFNSLEGKLDDLELRLLQQLWSLEDALIDLRKIVLDIQIKLDHSSPTQSEGGLFSSRDSASGI